ncbi:hypothetical protein O3301_27970 [Janthinobacterium sp. SUN211]|uniref:hypothetical protein n=1 Tax=Janthinobacterium sp. SUN211 TaxID=3014786 RepID=UPI002713A269|nr:hypothetical protein [Janthinobacterium sp. SUN211]MDO8052315.1 hypothetical protein [Janthinobacterium sp. SUN211]
MTDIEFLLCGTNAESGIAKKALDQLSASIKSFSTRSLSLLNDGPQADVISLGPFCARVLLENSCAALVGRLDPFRMLYLAEFQNQVEYEPGKRAKSAFSWTGDVLPVEEKNQVLWHLDFDVPKISRALFSKHMDHIYWKLAVENMLDYVSTLPNNPLFSEIYGLDSETYLRETGGRSSQLYSMLSKGVHWEFFSSALLFDEETVKNAIRDTCALVAHLGLISHFIPTSYAKLAPEVAAQKYLSFRGLFS